MAQAPVGAGAGMPPPPPPPPPAVVPPPPQPPLIPGAAPQAGAAPQVMFGGLPVGGGAPPLNRVQRPYRSMYSDATKDPFAGNYAAAYQEFVIPLGGVAVNTPQELRAKVFEVNNIGHNLAIVLLVRPATAPPEDPGLIQGYHRITKFSARLGLPATPFDGNGYAFLGDMHNMQVPYTVALDGNHFHQVNQTRVPTHAALDQLIAGAPDQNFFGPFNQNDADTELVTVRRSMYIPSKYMNLILDQGMTPKDAWLRIRNAMVTNGEAVACAPFVDWLRVAITRPSPNAVSRLAVNPPQPPTIVTPEEATIFSQFTWASINQDFPHLRSTPITAGAQQLASGLANLATESRLTRLAEEARATQRDRNKTPQDMYGTSLRKLLRFCNVVHPSALPVVWTQLAQAPKGNKRAVLQAAVQECCEANNLGHLAIQIMPSISKRILELAWDSAIPDDFALGLHPFALGFVTPEEAELQRMQSRRSDLIMSGEAAPSLEDADMLLDSSIDVHIPMTPTQATNTHQRTWMVFKTLMGDGHPLVEAYAEYVKQLASKELYLERIKPRNPQHALLTFPLLTRCTQLDTNHWLMLQAQTDSDVAPPDFCQVFQEIARDRDWAPRIPDKYVRLAPVHPLPSRAPQAADDQSTVSGLTSPTTGTTSTSGGTPQRENQMQRRTSPTSAIFDVYKAMNLTHSKLKRKLDRISVVVPTCGRCKVPYCLSWHVKGVCNSGCGSVANHVDHTPEEDEELAKWMKIHYKTE